MRPAQRWTLVLFSLLLLAIASPASADVIDPETEACQSKKAGDSCESQGLEGTCKTGSCCRPGPDGSVCSECLQCQDLQESSCSISSLSPGASASGSLILAVVMLLGLRRKR